MNWDGHEREVSPEQARKILDMLTEGEALMINTS